MYPARLVPVGHALLPAVSATECGDLADCRPLKYKFLNRRRYSACAVGQSDLPIPSAQFLRGIAHDYRHARILQHLNVIVVVSDGHNLLPRNAAMIGPAFEGVALRAA